MNPYEKHHRDRGNDKLADLLKNSPREALRKQRDRIQELLAGEYDKASPERWELLQILNKVDTFQEIQHRELAYLEVDLIERDIDNLTK